MGLFKVCLLTGVTLLLMREERRRGVAIVSDRIRSRGSSTQVRLVR